MDRATRILAFLAFNALEDDVFTRLGNSRPTLFAVSRTNHQLMVSGRAVGCDGVYVFLGIDGVKAHLRTHYFLTETAYGEFERLRSSL